MSEILTQKENAGSGENITYSTIFSGLFAKIEAPKRFNTLLYLRKNKNLLDRAFSRKLSFSKLRMQLDSPEFEKIFDVYASDQNVAKQLLNEDMIQELIQFHNEMEMDFELTIKVNCIYIRFWCGKIFETSKLKRFSLDRNTLYKYYRMLDFTFYITDKMLNLLNQMQ